MIKNPHERIHLLSSQILSQFGSPCYVYDLDVIKERVGQMLGGLSQIPTKTRLQYACKANTNIFLMKKLKEFGVEGIDCVSIQECILAQLSGFEKDLIEYTANFISDDEIDYALKEQILLNVGELDTIERIGKKYKGARIIIRINPDIGSGECDHVITAGRHTKFGIPVQDLDQVILLASKFELKIVGLHQHIGSNIKDEDQDKYVDSVKCIFEQAQKFPDLEHINIGGGVGVPYRKSDIPLDLQKVYKRVGELFQELVAKKVGQQIKIFVEPGRFLVAESGQLLCKVTSVKKCFDNIYIGVDSGFNHLIRPAFYGSYHEIVNLTSKIENSEKQITAHVVGNVCESSDYFAKDRIFSTQTQNNDIISIQNAGAYGYTMASNYNQRFRPPEVAVLSDGTLQLIRKRETIQDLLSTQNDL